MTIYALQKSKMSGRQWPTTIQSIFGGLSASGWICIIAKCIDKSRQRRELAVLDARLLEDIGITRADALKEAAKPFWN